MGLSKRGAGATTCFELRNVEVVWFVHVRVFRNWGITNLC
jgi:hypothetical protein